MSEKPQKNFLIDPELMALADKALSEQGITSASEGVSRLLRFFVKAPPELRPLILGQAPGDAACAIAKMILKSAKESVSLHRSRPGAAMRIAASKKLPIDEKGG